METGLPTKQIDAEVPAVIAGCFDGPYEDSDATAVHKGHARKIKDGRGCRLLQLRQSLCKLRRRRYVYLALRQDDALTV